MSINLFVDALYAPQYSKGLIIIVITKCNRPCPIFIFNVDVEIQVLILSVVQMKDCLIFSK